MSTEPTRFPSPIGGVPNPHDLAPAVIFAVLYALTVPLAVYRLSSKSSRNAFTIATAIFAIERVVDFVFRAVEAERPSLRTTAFWVNWLQSVYAVGFVSIAGDITNIGRVFLLNSTHASDAASADDERTLGAGRADDNERGAAKPFDSEAALMGAGVPAPQMRVQEVAVDEPQRRAWITRFGLLTLVMRITALALGGAYSGVYYAGTTDHTKAVLAQQLRYASDIIMVVYLQLVWVVLIWAWCTRPQRVARWPALFLVFIALLLCIPAIYRLAAMANYTDSLLSTAPGSLNSSSAKAVFYVLHMAPEWIASTALLSVNVKRMYGFRGWKG